MTTYAPPSDATQVRGRRTRSLTAALAGSLAAGAAAALALALVVFPGATESVVTGSLLLGFAAGWAVLVAAARRTGRPQPWARVPAAVMAVTGAGLVVLSPGAGAMAQLSWVWPPVLMALAAWTWIRGRRHLTRPARWLLAPAVTVLVAIAAGGVVAGVHESRIRDAYPAPGSLITVAGHRLHLDCRGTDAPTVVLLNGLGEFSGSWARVVEQLGDATRVCAYDRAGQGWSDEASEPQDGVAAAADLHTLLDRAGEAGPYVLVGHSTGGPYALTYAAQYPGEVAGMVLLDSSSPRQLTAMPDYPVQYALMRRGLALVPTLARIGLGPVLTPTSGLSGAAAEFARALGSTVRAKRTARDELTMVPSVFEQADQLTTLDDRPLAVVTASENLTTPGWPGEQERLAQLSSDSTHTTAVTTHQGLLEDAPGATASAAAISAVVQAVAAAAP
ncbi:alpha/beta fold hydrolase [Nocardioides donggukensis]|uniref:Alpha/beta fold hydrolase n=1 Tax=Nocardioides donggukensis TaxID=2774019 RepID=A0A927K7I3_9ACTN|nr:alpha/beta fold hydrolase [Nocardioides donggukensis]MBD8870605.1 alpha/beta fold hydrolase [Nocardioides donggukensis]